MSKLGTPKEIGRALNEYEKSLNEGNFSMSEIEDYRKLGTPEEIDMALDKCEILLNRMKGKDNINTELKKEILNSLDNIVFQINKLKEEIDRKLDHE